MRSDLPLRIVESTLTLAGRPWSRVYRKLIDIAEETRVSSPEQLADAMIRAFSESMPLLTSSGRDAAILAVLKSMRATLDAAGVERKSPPAEIPLRPVELPAIRNAVEWLRSRIDYGARQFHELDDAAKSRAFNAGAEAGTDVAERLRAAVADIAEKGGTLRDFRRAAVDEIEVSLLSPPRVETEFRTLLGRAYSTGQATILNDPLVSSEFPYVMYSAIHDSRVRPEHLQMEKLGLNGTAIYRADDPVWNTFRPPWAWNCRCHLIPMSIEDAAAYGVREAKIWAKTGNPPVTPQFVPPPPFLPPPGWIPTGLSL